MIPIECPKCGRRGNVPPDRLNSRLHCKVCNAVFHLDNTGHLVLGEPGQSEKQAKKQKARAQTSKGGPDFDLKQTWDDIPKGVKIGVPAALVALLAWQFLFSGDGGVPSYLSRAERIARAVATNNKGGVTSLATSESAEAAGKWFDMMRERAEKDGIGADAFASPSLLAGNADSDASLTVMVILSGGGTEPKNLPMNLVMKRSGSSWQFDGQQALSDAERSAATSAGAAKKK